MIVQKEGKGAYQNTVIQVPCSILNLLRKMNQFERGLMAIIPTYHRPKRKVSLYPIKRDKRDSDGAKIILS